jgi:hypothetical protein
MTIHRDRSKRTITIGSSQKIRDILKDFNMVNCIPAPTPIDHVSVTAADCPEPNSSDWLEMQKVPYRECVGRLTHLMRTTRPDLAFAVSVVNRYLHNPGHKHWNLVKRILRYLKGTQDLELCLGGVPTSNPKLHGYTDADWGGDPDTRRSTSGQVFYLDSRLISWSSKAQPGPATSTTQAEYTAAYQSIAECLWLRSFLSELGLLNASLPTTINCDNAPAIKIANHHIITPRSKHFDVKCHFIRDKIANGEITLLHTPGKSNIADLFTKPLGKVKFMDFCSALGLARVAKSVQFMTA